MGLRCGHGDCLMLSQNLVCKWSRGQPKEVRYEMLVQMYGVRRDGRSAHHF